MNFLLQIYLCPFKFKSPVLGGYLYKCLTVEQQIDANFMYHVFTVAVKSMFDKAYLVVQQGRLKTYEALVKPSNQLSNISINSLFHFYKQKWQRKQFHFFLSHAVRQVFRRYSTRPNLSQYHEVIRVVARFYENCEKIQSQVLVIRSQ